MFGILRRMRHAISKARRGCVRKARMPSLPDCRLGRRTMADCSDRGSLFIKPFSP
jgi:hypothetical protein